MPDATVGGPLIGRVLSHYEVLSKLGAGGMGEVYLAEDRRLGRKVALKVLPATLAADAERLRRLEREAKTLGSLDHPNIVTLYSVEEAEGIHFLTMAYVDGETLAEQISEDGLPVARLVGVATALAEALAAAHEQGVVHRDLKPGNVMVDRSGRVRVLDFGLAKVVADPGSAGLGELATMTGTADGLMVGTVPYMSPEQAEGRPVDARSDLFALGTLLYEMATGIRPFQGESAMAVASAILKDTPEDLRARRPDLPERLVELIERCLEKDRERRIQTSWEVLDELLATKRELESLAYAATTAAPAVRVSKRSRTRWGLPAAAAMALVIAALLGFDVGGLRQKLTGIGGEAPIRSLAVLPLRNLSGDESQEYFVDGMTEALITDLSKIRALKVISRTSAMRYKTTEKSLPEIARELGVEAIIEGSIVREAGRVRVNAQLVRAENEENLWADSYERDLESILALQSEIARAIVREIRAQVTPDEAARLAVERKVDPDAYDAYLKGTYHWQKLMPADLDTAERYFELAVAKDPAYAPAHAGLAWVWGARQQMGLTPAHEAGPKSKAAALRALALDDSSAAAHEALAAARTWTDWDWAGAAPEWQRALELDPNAANAHAYYAHFLAITGRSAEALRHSERALELDPFNALPRGLHAWALYFDRRYDEALAAARAALATQPDDQLSSFALQYILRAKGMRDEKLANQRHYYARYPERLAAFEQGLADAGYEGAQRAVADLLAARYEKAGDPTLPYEISERYLDAGDSDRALKWLEEEYEVRDPNLPYLACMPHYDPLRSDPRFQALLRRMNLPPQPPLAGSV